MIIIQERVIKCKRGSLAPGYENVKNYFRGGYTTMLMTMKPILDAARAGGYGVAAPNIHNEDSARVAIAAAENMNAPVILDISGKAHPDLKFFGNMVAQLAKESTAPVAINFDHGKTFEKCVEAMMSGFTSIMVDRSKLPFDENVAEVKELTKFAHAAGLSVEAELGFVGRAELTSEEVKDYRYTHVDEAVKFVELTGVDCLAVSIGTAHGMYPKGFVPKLNFELLEELRREVPVPLVIHGGSGSGDENLAKACRMGICKVNLSTDNFQNGLKYIQENELTTGFMVVPTFYKGFQDKIEFFMDLLGSKGKDEDTLKDLNTRGHKTLVNAKIGPCYK